MVSEKIRFVIMRNNQIHPKPSNQSSDAPDSPKVTRKRLLDDYGFNTVLAAFIEESAPAAPSDKGTAQDVEFRKAPTLPDNGSFRAAEKLGTAQMKDIKVFH
jgi:hypothetical protein